MPLVTSETFLDQYIIYIRYQIRKQLYQLMKTYPDPDRILYMHMDLSICFTVL